jgi:MFS family permease
MWWLPRHSPAEELRRAHLAGGGTRDKQTPFVVALRDRLVLAVTAHQGLISLAMGASFSFLALRLEDGLMVGPLLVGLAFATQDITGGLAQPIFGRMADTYSRRMLVSVGLLINGALLACVGIVPSYWLMVLLLFAMGASGAISQVAASAIQVVAGRRTGMGTVLGIGSAANGAGIVIGSVAGGFIVDIEGLAAAFFLGGAIMIVGVPVFLFLTRGLATGETSDQRQLAATPEAAGGH